MSAHGDSKTDFTSVGVQVLEQFPCAELFSDISMLQG